jgi:hypothetical protein
MSLQLFYIPPWTNLTVGVAVTSLVLWKGGWRERTLAAMILSADVFGYGVQCMGYYWGWQPWPVPPWFGWTVDIGELATCVAFALSSNRYWTIWASSACLLGPATRIVRSAVPGVTPWAYQSAQVIWWYLLLAVLLGGVWEAHRSRGPVAGVPSRRFAVEGAKSSAASPS